MLTEKEKLSIERRELNKTISQVELIENKMFHEIYPDLDYEIHKIVYNKRIRLRAIRVSLQIKYEL